MTMHFLIACMKTFFYINFILGVCPKSLSLTGGLTLTKNIHYFLKRKGKMTHKTDKDN